MYLDINLLQIGCFIQIGLLTFSQTSPRPFCIHSFSNCFALFLYCSLLSVPASVLISKPILGVDAHSHKLFLGLSFQMRSISPLCLGLSYICHLCLFVLLYYVLYQIINSLKLVVSLRHTRCVSQ